LLQCNSCSMSQAMGEGPDVDAPSHAASLEAAERHVKEMEDLEDYLQVPTRTLNLLRLPLLSKQALIVSLNYWTVHNCLR